MLLSPSAWPLWVQNLAWTVGILFAAYLAGHLLRAIVGARISALARRSGSDWDDVLVSEIGRRIPFWSLLIGLWLALPRWPLSADAHLLAARAISAIGVASVTLAMATVAARLVGTFGPRATPAAPVSNLSQTIARLVVLVLGLLVIIRSFGYDITPYLTALGVGGLAVALALQDPLSNLFSGLSISLSGQVRIGDYVRMDSGVEGYITDFDWRATTIRMLSGSSVIVPNSKLAQAIVTNFHRPSRELSVSVDFSVGHVSDLDQVERVTREVAREVMQEVAGGVPTFEPSVRFQTFGTATVGLSVGMRAQEFANQFAIKHEFVKRLHARFHQEGIVIPPPRPNPDAKGRPS